ncbi:MAG: hypothetical protein Q8794_01830, partial [Candidatus Phytoplasma australasiaticum]|nr:hypothetical protein [Candidatus Phytoplasma australasiaticum]
PYFNISDATIFSAFNIFASVSITFSLMFTACMISRVCKVAPSICFFVIYGNYISIISCFSRIN